VSKPESDLAPEFADAWADFGRLEGKVQRGEASWEEQSHCQDLRLFFCPPPDDATQREQGKRARENESGTTIRDHPAYKGPMREFAPYEDAYKTAGPRAYLRTRGRAATRCGPRFAANRTRRSTRSTSRRRARAPARKAGDSDSHHLAPWAHTKRGGR
jgi:hypothetical protein